MISVSLCPRQGQQTIAKQIYCLSLFRSVQTPLWHHVTQVKSHYFHLAAARRLASDEQIAAAHTENVGPEARLLGGFVVLDEPLRHTRHDTFGYTLVGVIV